MKAYGRDNSTVRTAEQTETAKFWSENAAVQWPRTLRNLAVERGLDLAQSARMLAMTQVATADAVLACFDAKYHFLFWRPAHAIWRADSDGNPATESDPTWTPLLFVNHPEYPGAHGCWTAAVAETALNRAASPDSKILLNHFGGAVARVAADANAFAQRNSPYFLNIAARWTDPGESELHIGWAREVHAAMTPFATGGVYVNFLGEEGHDRIKAAYGERGYQRLVVLKNRYDPTNFFRVNQNIPPYRPAHDAEYHLQYAKG